MTTVTAERVAVRAADAFELHGCWHRPATRRPFAVLSCHGTAGAWHNSVQAWLGPMLAERGIPVLSLNRRDSIDYGRADILFDDAIGDVGTGMATLLAAGYAAAVVIGHSLGTTFATCWVARNPDAPVAGLALLGAVHHAVKGQREKVQGHFFDDNLAMARDLQARGLGDTVVQFPLLEGRLLPRTPDSYLSWWDPAIATGAEADITRINVPTLLLRASNDEVTGNDMSQAVLAAGLAAGVAIRYDIIEPAVPGGDPLAGHRFVGDEAAAADLLAIWIESVAQ